jgi:FolB domain-containing protein
MIIRIKNLRLRTIIGLNDWERKKEQDILINLKIQVDDETAVTSDDLADGVDYKTIKYRIVEEVEKTGEDELFPDRTAGGVYPGYRV